GVVDVIVAANHVGDGHVEIVDDDAEVVGRDAVAADDHQVVELGVGDFDASLDLIVPGHGSLRRVLEAEYRRHARRWRLARFHILGAPAAVAARLLAPRHLRGSYRSQFLRRRLAAYW